MKKYYHKLKGRTRFMGYSTGDKDISISYFSEEDLKQESTHIHTESDELYVPIEGEAILWVNEEEHKLTPGTIIRVEKGEKHRILSITQKPFAMYTLKVPDESDDKVNIN